MNPKLAKKLRRIAKSVPKNPLPNELCIGKTGTKIIGYDKEGEPITNDYTILINHPRSVRGLYRKLKKAAKKEK